MCRVLPLHVLSVPAWVCLALGRRRDRPRPLFPTAHTLTTNPTSPPPQHAQQSSKTGGKLASIINYRVKVTLNDTRTLIGQLLAFDKYMNLVLAECEEFRRVKSSTSKAAAVPGVTIEDEDDGEDEMKRTLGLVILRGETIVTLSVQGPPPVQDEQRSGPQIGMGPGVGAPAGRGMGLAPPTMRQAPQAFAPPPGMPGMMPPGFPVMAPPPPGYGPR